MKTKIFLAAIFSLFLTTSANIRFHFVYKQNEPIKLEQKFKEIVTSSFNLKDESTPYYKAVIKVYASEFDYADYLVVDLYRKDSYLIEVVRLDLKDNKVIAITNDYDEPEDTRQIPCGTCPDPEVEFVISYIEDALFPGAIEHGWGTWAKMTTQWGINAALVIGINETKQTMLNYLSCPKLVGWGRIGHGLKDKIQFNQWTEKLTADEVIQYKDILKGKIFIFNSCLSHNDPFESAMMEAGVKFFAAGDISLSGKKEFVFSEFFINAIQNEMELGAAMQKAQLNYPNAWGWSSPSSGPLYFKLDITPLENIISQNKNLFSLLINDESIQFSSNTNTQNMQISIYDLSGKEIYKKDITGPSYIWHKNTNSGNSIVPGAYIALIKNDQNKNGIVKKLNISNK